MPIAGGWPALPWLRVVSWFKSGCGAVVGQAQAIGVYMFLCVYVCLHVFIGVYMWLYVYMCLYVLYVCMCVYECLYVPIRFYMCQYASISVYRGLCPSYK